MAKLNVFGGSWPKGTGRVSQGVIALPKSGSWSGFEAIHLGQICRIEKATEESVKRLSGTVGWAAVGAIALGPLGLLAGLIAGGRGTDIGFIAEFRDGRVLIGSTDPKTYLSILAAATD